MTLTSPLDEIRPSQQPWMDPGCFAVVPRAGFGYWSEYGYYSCSEEKLREFVATDHKLQITLVSVPGSDRLVACAEVASLRDAIVARGRLAATEDRLLPAIFAAAGIALAIYAAFTEPAAVLIVVFFGLFFGGIPLIAKYLQLRRVAAFPSVPTPESIRDGRFEAWMAYRPSHPDYVLLGALILVVVVQLALLLTGRNGSATAAGLVKARVAEGELWRMATALFLHGSLTHAWVNGLSLAVLGISVGKLMHRAYVPIVFIVAGLTGSAFSVLGTQLSSIGASGGIMGLVGLLASFAYVHRRHVPLRLLGVIDIAVFTAIVGLVGYQLIDNWAHLGGFVAGAFVGLIVARTTRGVLPITPGKTTRLTEVASYIIVIASAGAAIWMMLIAKPLP